MSKFGVIKYSSINIGDEIQSVASMRFLPSVDYYIHRERTDEFRSLDHEKVKMIMNAWWMQEPKHFPPSDDIDPLFVSFHFRYDRRDVFMTEKTKAYLKAHSPIGCRDTGTVEYLKENGIDAYFTGCLTSTLLPNPSLKGRFMSDYVLCVDCPEEVVQAVRARSERPVYSMTRMLSHAFTSVDRFRLAKYVLFLYHNAYCVVTPRLHVSLPATAFVTPVCLIYSEKLERKRRFEGLDDLFHQVEMDAYIADGSLYDINNPPENPDNYKHMADQLAAACREFTGHDSGKSALSDDYNPMIDIIQILAYDKKVADRELMFAHKKELLYALTETALLGKTRHDLKY